MIQYFFLQSTAKGNVDEWFNFVLNRYRRVDLDKNWRISCSAATRHNCGDRKKSSNKGSNIFPKKKGGEQ
jgi:hypothetical protein